MSALCRMAGMSKQNFYRTRQRRSRRGIEEEFILELVREERRMQPFLGARKLLVRLAPSLEEAGVAVGRNRFFELLRQHALLVPRRRGSARTTDSRHRFRVYINTLKDSPPTAPHEAWVADLTYIRTADRFVYLALVTDAFSRKIVGWHVDASLEAAGCVLALQMALQQLPPGARPIHHSDRGTQYCCHDYMDILLSESQPLRISMTEENHCYENGKAERVNGILKQEYGLGGTLRNLGEAKRMVAEAVMLYNTRRPHMALAYATPAEVHERKSGKQAA